ncbi:hypothetical protein AB5N19_05791 [Seiridium cardinale]|uniref:Uncharacterized protein n=1 Tax=Seiridium cardinale TaxID=138064 RepID=A0ABR2XH12_9PEZI
MAVPTKISTSPKDGGLPEPLAVGNQRKWNLAKVILRAIALFFEVVAICHAIALGTMGGYQSGVMTTLPVTGLAFIWDLTELIVICVRRDKSRGIKAAAHVGVDLVLCILAVASTAVTSILAMEFQSSRYTLKDMPWYQQYIQSLAVMASLCAMTGVISILHFVLFVLACVEVDRRRKDRRIQQVIMAMIANGQTPMAYSPYEHGAHPGDFSHKYGGGGVELESSMLRAELNGTREQREQGADTTYPSRVVESMLRPNEMSVGPEEAGINHKVLLDGSSWQIRS